MVKIAVMGTVGVGKTTESIEVFGMLKKFGANVHYLPEVTELTKIPFNKDGGPRKQQGITCQQIANEIEYQKPDQYDHLVTDGCTINIHSFYVWQCKQHGIEPKSHLEEMAISWAREEYDYIVEMPFHKQLLEAKGLRDADEEFQSGVQSIIQNLISKYDIKTIPLLTAKKVLLQDPALFPPDRQRLEAYLGLHGYKIMPGEGLQQTEFGDPYAATKNGTLAPKKDKE